MGRPSDRSARVILPDPAASSRMGPVVFERRPESRAAQTDPGSNPVIQTGPGSAVEVLRGIDMADGAKQRVCRLVRFGSHTFWCSHESGVMAEATRVRAAKPPPPALTG